MCRMFSDYLFFVHIWLYLFFPHAEGWADFLLILHPSSRSLRIARSIVMPPRSDPAHRTQFRDATRARSLRIARRTVKPRALGLCVSHAVQ